jgi:D-amino peptidase
MLKIPVIFLSGDAALCESAKALIPGITAVAVNIGRGAAVTSLHPEDGVGLIREGVRTAVEKGGKDCLIKLPEHFETTIKYQDHRKAYKFSFYPGARLADEKTLRFESDNYMEVLRFYHFVL